MGNDEGRRDMGKKGRDSGRFYGAESNRASV